MSNKKFVLENSIPMLSTFSEAEALLRAEGVSNAAGDYIADSTVGIDAFGVVDSSELKLASNFSEPELFSNCGGKEKYSGIIKNGREVDEMDAVPVGIPTLSTTTPTPISSQSASKQSGWDKLTSGLNAATNLVTKGGEVVDKVKGLTHKGEKAAQDHANDNNPPKHKGISVTTIAIVGGAVLITGVVSYFLFFHKSAPKVAAVVV